MNARSLIIKMYRQLDNMVAGIYEAAQLVMTTDDIVLRDMLVTDIGREYLKVEELGSRIEKRCSEAAEVLYYGKWTDEQVNAAAESANQVEAFQRMQNYLASL